MYRDSTLQCVLDSLSIFGESTKSSLMSQLTKEGISFTPDAFDVLKFCRVIETLLDRSADFIFIKIIDDICTRSNTSLASLGLGDSSRRHSLSELLTKLLSVIEVA